MKIEDLVILIKAGYTKADIEQLGISLGAEVPPIPEEQIPDEQPEEVKPDEPKQDDERMKQLETKLDYVINRFNYMAVKDSQQPDQHVETVDDILSSVLK